jgi:hypothetical protein
MSVLSREPVRAAVYSVAVAVAGLLVALGVIDDAASAALTGGVTAVLAALTEAARAKVTPVASGAHAAGLDEDAQDA